MLLASTVLRSVLMSRVNPPWFSGICLDGDLVLQYEIDYMQEFQETLQPSQSEELAIDGLAPINIFVGANNSGKSRLMRELFAQEIYAKFKLSSSAELAGDHRLESLLRKLAELQSSSHERFADDKWIHRSGDGRDGKLTLHRLNQMLASNANRGSNVNYDLREIMQKLELHGVVESIRSCNAINRCYVPMLRGMRPPSLPSSQKQGVSQHEHADIYATRSMCDYFSSGSASLGWDPDRETATIFTGLTLYSELRKCLLGRTQKLRDSVREYEEYLSKNFFSGQSVTLVPVEEGGNDVVHIKIGDKDDYPIYMLGDGLQSLIICTYPIFAQPAPALFFLEEPDIGMHPSLQRNFLEFLSSQHQLKGHQFFLTTHSNHLLDLLQDNHLVSIYSFREVEESDAGQGLGLPGISTADQPQSKPRLHIRQTSQYDRSILMRLGVRPSSTYLANATVWVEGVSDCAYIRAYLHAFFCYLQSRGGEFGDRLARRLQSYKEDRHYAFVEYSGANLTHFDFSECEDHFERDSGSSNSTVRSARLCGNAIVIADGDVSEKGRRESVFRSQLAERLVVLPGKEIENIIPQELMKEQIRKDANRKARKHNWPQSLDECLDKIEYCNYSRNRGGEARGAVENKFQGLGIYLHGLGLVGYCKAESSGSAVKAGSCGSGTLSPYEKSRWASGTDGIPCAIKSAAHESVPLYPDHGDNAVDGFEAVSAADGSPHAPPIYISHDAVWLCIVICCHVARCNQDGPSLKMLEHLKDWVQSSFGKANSLSDPESAALGTGEDLTPRISPIREWPVFDKQALRKCLLGEYVATSGKS